MPQSYVFRRIYLCGHPDEFIGVEHLPHGRVHHILLPKFVGNAGVNSYEVSKYEMSFTLERCKRCAVQNGAQSERAIMVAQGMTRRERYQKRDGFMDALNRWKYGKGVFSEVMHCTSEGEDSRRHNTYERVPRTQVGDLEPRNVDVRGDTPRYQPMDPIQSFAEVPRDIWVRREERVSEGKVQYPPRPERRPTNRHSEGTGEDAENFAGKSTRNDLQSADMIPIAEPGAAVIIGGSRSEGAYSGKRTSSGRASNPHQNPNGNTEPPGNRTLPSKSGVVRRHSERSSDRAFRTARVGAMLGDLQGPTGLLRGSIRRPSVDTTRSAERGNAQARGRGTSGRQRDHLQKLASTSHSTGPLRQNSRRAPISRKDLDKPLPKLPHER